MQLPAVQWSQVSCADSLIETVALLAAQDEGVAVWAAVYIASPEGPERTYFCCNFDYNMGNYNAWI